MKFLQKGLVKSPFELTSKSGDRQPFFQSNAIRFSVVMKICRFIFLSLSRTLAEGVFRGIKNFFENEVNIWRLRSSCTEKVIAVVANIKSNFIRPHSLRNYMRGTNEGSFFLCPMTPDTGSCMYIFLCSQCNYCVYDFKTRLKYFSMSVEIGVRNWMSIDGCSIESLRSEKATL